MNKNYYYYLHFQDYIKHRQRQEKVRSQYVSNLQEVIGKVDIGKSPALLNRKYIWGRECTVSLHFTFIFVQKYQLTMLR